MLAKTNPLELFYQSRGIPGPVPNHYDHLHLAYQRGGIIRDFARAAADTGAPKRAVHALFMAGLAESGMRDLSYGDASSQGVLQLLASTAQGYGISPHDEYAVAKGFLTHGYWGKGGAIGLANRGTGAAMIAHLVQGNATGTGVYSAQSAAAARLLEQSGLRFPGNRATLAKAVKKTGKATKKGKKGKGGGGLGDIPTDELDPLTQAWVEAQMAANELIGAGNLEALQRYQTGMAQAPILGIGGPSFPSMTPSLSTTPQFGTPVGAPTVGSNQTLNFGAAGGKGKYGWTGGLNTHIHNHTYIDGKEIKTRTRKEIRKSARRANRVLPSAGGGL
jgi:hypothetical protein